VIFSGGQIWEDHDLLWRGLDSIRARPRNGPRNHRTDQRAGDACAGWASARVNRSSSGSTGAGAKAAVRKRLLMLNPVEGVICEGSGTR
jgi:hypothetical protein